MTNEELIAENKSLCDKLDMAVKALTLCANAADGWNIDHANLVASTTLKELSNEQA